MRRAPALSGPWSEASLLYEVAAEPGVYHYGGKPHKITNNGRFVIVTFNDNGPIEMHANNPELYWPQVLKLALPVD